MNWDCSFQMVLVRESYQLWFSWAEIVPRSDGFESFQVALQILSTKSRLILRYALLNRGSHFASKRIESIPFVTVYFTGKGSILFNSYPLINNIFQSLPCTFLILQIIAITPKQFGISHIQGHQNFLWKHGISLNMWMENKK